MDSALSIIAVLLLGGLVVGVWEVVRLLRRVRAQLSALVRIQRRAHERDDTVSTEPEAAKRCDLRVVDRRRVDRDARAQAFVS